MRDCILQPEQRCVVWGYAVIYGNNLGVYWMTAIIVVNHIWGTLHYSIIGSWCIHRNSYQSSDLNKCPKFYQRHFQIHFLITIFYSVFLKDFFSMCSCSLTPVYWTIYASLGNNLLSVNRDTYRRYDDKQFGGWIRVNWCIDVISHL